ELAVERSLTDGTGQENDSGTLEQRQKPGGSVRESVAVGAELVLVQTGADAHLEASARDEVDRRSDLGQIGRVAVGHARAHLTEADALGRGGERRHEGPRLVCGLLARHRWGGEVVIDPQRLPRSRFRGLSDALHATPLRAG